MSRYRWVPRYMRDLARDVDYLDALPPEARAWMEDFLDEHYGATPHGIGTTEHLLEANRRSHAQRVDLFAAGLRASGGVPETLGGSVQPGPGGLDSPAAQELLRKLRELRPKFDETDGRRRARFSSPMAEGQFFKLRAQLKALLEIE